MRLIATFIAAFLLVHVAASIIRDPDLASDLQYVWDNDFTLYVTNIRWGHKSSNSTTFLLMIRYQNGAKNVITLDRMSKKVILANIDGPRRSMGHVKVEKGFKHELADHLIFVIRRSRNKVHLDVYVECRYQGTIDTSKGFRPLEPRETIEVFRGRRSRITVFPVALDEADVEDECDGADDWSSRDNLWYGTGGGHHGRYHDSAESDESGVGHKHKRSLTRGDIGIQSLDERDCLTDDQIVKTLNKLIEAINRLWIETEENKKELRYVRRALEHCAVSRPSGELFYPKR